MKLITRSGQDIVKYIKDRMDSAYVRLDNPTEFDNIAAIRTEIRVLKELLLVLGYNVEVEIKITENTK